MKTAISIPDPIFDEADKLADRLGVSRSELYVRALKLYLVGHRHSKVTEALNDVYSRHPSTLEPGLVALQAASLTPEKW